MNINAVISAMVDRGDAVLAFDWVSHGEGLTLECYEFSYPGFMPPNDFIARSIHCAYGTMERGDRERFRESYRLEFSILQKVFYSAPLSAIPDRGVLFPADASDEVIQPGQLTVLLYIAAHMPFSIKIIGKPVHVSKLRFLPFLNGLMDRGVR